MSFVELKDGEGNDFITPVSLLGVAFNDAESGNFVIMIDGNPTEIMTPYEEYRAMVMPEKMESLDE